MNIKDAIRRMHDTSKTPYTDASRKMGRSSQFISALLQSNNNPGLDTCAAIANAFGYRLIVRGNTIFYSIKSDEAFVADRDEIAAKDAVKCVADACPLSYYGISKAMGKSTAYVSSIIARDTTPSIETFVAIAEACNDEVLIRGRGESLYLSKRARFTAANRAKRDLHDDPKVPRSVPTYEPDLFSQAIRAMHEATGISIKVASVRSGHSESYISSYLDTDRVPRINACGYIANGFGYELSAQKGSLKYVVVPGRRYVKKDEHVPANLILTRMLENSPYTKARIVSLLGFDTTITVESFSSSTAPKLDTFLAVARTCGFEVLLCGEKNVIHLDPFSVDRFEEVPASEPAWQQRGAELQALVNALKAGENPPEQHGAIEDSATQENSVEASIAQEYEEFISRRPSEPAEVTQAELPFDLSPADETIDAPIIDESDEVPFLQQAPLSTPEPIIVPSMAQTAAARQSSQREQPMTREEAKLAEFKKRLLDLSMRNNLLNYRDKKTGTIRVLEPDMATTYQRLVISERPLTFRESSHDDDDATPRQSSSNTTIVTERPRADLIRSLRRLDTVARSSIDEQGINILYLAFGMLRWVDDAHKEHTAPLVMVPVRLTRASARSSFVLQVGDDDPVVNPTLTFYLQQMHGLTLPPFEKEDQPQFFLMAVSSLVLSKPGWSVSTDVVLSTFQFQKLSMYHDLEARSAEILAHPVVKAIMGDRSALDISAATENPDDFAPTDTYQVVDADASQQAAIIAAHKGESFVLQGPPGTGKSQTITNIIADCLGSGKKVLFVSEKKAALDVVHHRLTQSKLDDFCLVLHSNKAGKKEVLSQLDRTLGLYGTTPRMSAAAETRLSTMVRLRNELNLYADEVYSQVEPMGRSPYEVIGLVAGYEQNGIPWISCHIEGLDEMTPSKVTEIADVVRIYARTLAQLGEPPEKNPWTVFGITDLEYGESGKIIRSFTDTSKGARELIAIWQRITSELQLELSPTILAMETCQGLLRDLAKIPVVPRGVSERKPEEARKLIDKWVTAQTALTKSHEEVFSHLKRLASLDLELDLRANESRFDTPGYSDELADELNRRLSSISHYMAWQMVSKPDLDLTVGQLAGRVNTYDRHKGTILADYHPEVLDIDFIAMEGRFKTDYQSLFKRLGRQYKDDIRTLTGLHRSSGQINDEEARRVLELLHNLSNEERSLEEDSKAFKTLLGNCYRGMKTDFNQIARKRQALDEAKACLDALAAHSSIVADLHDQEVVLSDVFEGIFDQTDKGWTKRANSVIEAYDTLLATHGERKLGVSLGRVTPLLADSDTSKDAKDLSSVLQSTLTRYGNAFHESSDRARGADITRRNMDSLANAIDKAVDAGTAPLERSVAYARAKKACEDLGLSDFITAIAMDKRALDEDFLDQYDEIVRHTIYRLWLGGIVWQERPALRNFSASEHERRIQKFTDLDAEQLDIDQARVLTELFPRIPSPNVRARGKDEISILLRELNKKSRIRPIRKLFADIPHAVLALKPCLMMSPLSVSTYLESATFQFDTVIFDEASQVRTEDALGVVSRGKQVIIAGDSKQLPPTNFFAATVAEDDDDGDEEYYEQAGSFDSVLDEAALLNPISLKWHYRSRDESLITFSNEEIYDGDLFTFPSNRTSGRDSGVEYVYVKDGIYEGSRKGNTIEAIRVADLVMQHFATYGTERSLGVIALGENQSRVIENVLLERRVANPETERFFDTGVDEPFFVKNLENVQGDERDTIILCVGYAKGPNGKLSHNFGPINMEGGERRLNVAVTRARTNLKLVTSLDPSEIDENRVTNIGPTLLKRYLSYAKVGPSGEGANLLREYGYVDKDVFAEVLKNVLEGAGYEVEEQVGRSGCKVDLAVRHPEHRDCFCIGIVCDGDSYHAATTARDRDRLRIQVLRSMGWSLHHVWASAWATNSEQQKQLLLDAVNKAVDQFVPPVEREVVEMPVVASAPETPKESPTPQVPDVKPAVNEASSAQTALISEYVEVERHIEEHRYGFQKYPEYKPPRKGSISEFAVLKQLIVAQAPFSVEYFLKKYLEFCYPPNQRMTEIIRRTGIGYLQTKLKDTVIVRKEHGYDYVFRKDQRKLLPRVVGSRTISDISTSELREGVLLVLHGYLGELDRKALIEETWVAFGFTRRGRVIEERIGEAIDDLRLYGKVKVIDGYYVPTDR